MRIAIIGAGNVGRALGEGWSKSGHEIRYGVPDPAAARYQALPGEQVKRPSVAASDARVVVIATPWDETEAAIAGLGNLTGKIAIDCTNPLAMTEAGLGLALGYEQSGGERVAQRAKGAAVFKTLNQTGAENMLKAARFSSPPLMFVAGDDAGKKSVVMTLVAELGFEAVDAGPLVSARLLEPLAMLWIDQSMKYGRGRDFAFALVRRG